VGICISAQLMAGKGKGCHKHGTTKHIGSEITEAAFFLHQIEVQIEVLWHE
jgi:hypothetical protein